MSITAAVFILSYLAGLALCVFRHPIFGLYTYIAVFYLDAHNRWWGSDIPDIRWSFVVAAVTFAMTVIRDWGDRPKWLSRKPILLFTIYVTWMWMQWPWVIDRSLHEEGLGYFTKYLIVLFIIYKLVDTRHALRMFMLANVIGCLYLGYLAYIAPVAGRLDGVGGPGINDSNTLGMHMSVVVFLAAALFLGGRQWWRWIAAATIAFTMNTVVLAGSRGAFLAIAAGGLAFYFLRPAGQIKNVLIYACLGLVLFGSLANEGFWNRMGTINDAVTMSETMDGSARSRIVIIKAQFRMLKSYPLGGGFRSTSALSFKYIPLEYHSKTKGVPRGRSSHNTLMSALVDQGIPGFVIWTWIILSMAKSSLVVRNYARSAGDTELAWLNAGIGAGIVAVVIGGMFAPFLKAEVYVWLIAICCAIRAMADSQEKKCAIDDHS